MRCLHRKEMFRPDVPPYKSLKGVLNSFLPLSLQHLLLEGEEGEELVTLIRNQ